MYGRITLVFLSYQCAGPRPTSAGRTPCVCQSRHGIIWDPHADQPVERRDRGGRLAPSACGGAARPFQARRPRREGRGEARAAAAAGRLRSDSDTPSRPPPRRAAFERRFPHLNGNSEPPGGAFLPAQPVNPCRGEGGASPRQQRPAPGTGPAMLLSRT